MPSASRGRARIPVVEAVESRTLLSVSSARALLIGATVAAEPRVQRVLANAGNPSPLQELPGNVYRVDVSPGVNLSAVQLRLRSVPGVRFVERDLAIHVDAVVPNDPGFSQQWGLESPNNVDIDASDAWSFSTGTQSTIVAVIDSGIDVRHPDLVSRLWVNPREIAGNNADDDRNGMVDDVNGWNFINNTSNLSDDAGHGSHVAGIIGAATDNGTGVAGVDWQARIMALKFIDAAGNGAISDAVKAIYYAVDHGARVINASWGGPTPSRALNDAIRYAAARNVVFVIAAGNESVNNDVYRSYPASYRLSNTIVVAAVDQAGRLASFSNFGKKSVDLGAPGVGIRSTLPGNNYGTMSGTSMATPFVSGVASLLVSQNPSFTAGQLVQRIIGTVKPLSSLAGKTVSGGMVDAGRALNPAIPTQKPAAAKPAATKFVPAQRVVIKSKLAASAGDNIRAEILGSVEYFNLQGGSNQAFLAGLYGDVVDRNPTTKELNTYLPILNRGTARSEVARVLLGTEEAQRTKVARWYKFDLMAPATIAALKGYGPVIQLARRMFNKVGESMVHAALFASGDFLKAYGGSYLGALGGVYYRATGRDIRPDEADYWMTRLNQGVRFPDIALSVLASPEARRVRVATWYINDLHRIDSLDQLTSDPNVMARAGQLVD